VPTVHADLLEQDRHDLRRRRVAWCVAIMAVCGCSGWLMRGQLVAYLHEAQPSIAGASVALTRAQAKQVPDRRGAGNDRVQLNAQGTSEDDAQGSAATAAAQAGSDVGASRAPAAVQTRPLSAWLAEVAHDADRDLVLSPEVRGDLTATVGGKLSWEQRLSAFARVFGFDFTVGDGLIEVRQQTHLRSSGELRGGGLGAKGTDYDRDPGAGAAAASVASSSAVGHDSSAVAPALAKPASPPETRVAPLAHAPAKEMAAMLAKAAEPLGISVVPELSSNALVISGPRGAIDRALALLRELDRPRRRVLLEAKIVELAHSARRDLGVEWKLAGDAGAEVKFPPPLSVTGSAALTLATGGAYALDARISAMEADGRVRVVSRPSVVMLEGSPATVESVRIMRIRLPSQGSVVGGEVVQAGNGGRATEEIPVGVRLEVTPAVRAGRRVLLRIKAKSSSLGAPLPPDDIPEELSRMVDAELLVADGETAVLGGLQREAGDRNSAGVPGLRDVPMLGTLFGRRSREREAEELLVMVTPRVLD